MSQSTNEAVEEANGNISNSRSRRHENGHEMSRADVYNTLYGSEEYNEDEDSDFDGDFDFEFSEKEEESDWEAVPNGGEVLRISKWFCVNCTLDNVDTDRHCYYCGEHKRSGILKHGFLASPVSKAGGLIEDVANGVDGVKESHSQNSESDKLTAIGFDERMLLHEEVDKPHPHPERPNRLRAIASSLATAGIFPGRCSSILAREITREELQTVHSLSNIEAVEHTNHYLSSYFTPDTYANRYSACAARLAAGLCVDLAKAICSGAVKNGFALVRPPGHHAGVSHAMGFCLHNNAAIAASAAQLAGAKKILIVDWDVHHGNGTQEIFDKSKSVLYVSLHRHEGGTFYPGTGAADEVGTMGAEGYCVNIPWSNGGVGDNDYVFAFKQVVLPIASKFDPDFTIISAGFDAARGDPLGCCDVTPTGYAQMTQMCSDLSGGKLMVILEGGYNLRSISSSATAVIKVLLGESCEHDMEQATPTPSGLLTVLEVLKIQMKYWPSLVSNFLKLQSDHGCGRQDKKKRRRQTRTMLPLWWKLGRKRWLYPVLCKRLSHQLKGY